MAEWLIDYFKAHFQLDYSDLTYGTALGGSLRLFAALRHLFTTQFHSRIPVLRDHVIAGMS
jgi:1-aminocyclopropane-1-carboxylate synthase